MARDLAPFAPCVVPTYRSEKTSATAQHAATAEFCGGQRGFCAVTLTSSNRSHRVLGLIRRLRIDRAGLVLSLAAIGCLSWLRGTAPGSPRNARGPAFATRGNFTWTR